MKKVSRLAILVALIYLLGSLGIVRAEILPPRGMGQIGLQAVVLCDSLTVRQKPSSASKAVETVRYGHLPIVMEQSDGWAYCALGDSEDSPMGWINADYLAIDPAWYRTEEETPVYAWDDEAAPKVALLDKDVTLPIIKEEGDWLIVSLRGAAGWIQKNDADRLAGAQAEGAEGLFDQLAGLSWSFSSGTGGWSTDIEIRADGSFTGTYHDAEMAESGDEYPEGTIYGCAFSGRMTLMEPVGEGVWRVRVDELALDEGQVDEAIEDGVRYVTTEPYGIREGDEMLLYQPGTPVSALSEEMQIWAHVMEQDSRTELENWFLSNEANDSGFVGIAPAYQPDDPQWEQGDAEGAGNAMAPRARGHYAFQPKVCSTYLEEVFGKGMCETWFNLVDAVMAGEDTFACPDVHTYDWVMGQFPERCFPVLVELIDYARDRDHPVKRGVASFTYLVPRDEAAARIAAFAEQIESILNENLEDDDSDFEKALALYEYFSRTYTYDYETAAYDAGYPEWLSSYRVFATGTGICQEFSTAYAYLLMQAGVDATTMSGTRSYDNAAHQWAYIRLNGHNYHIDPTYVIGDDRLDYFLMDDNQREQADCYAPSTFNITSNYAQDHPHPDYVADDDTFRPLWGGTLEAVSREDSRLVGWKYDENWEREDFEFDYSGY